MEAAFRMGNTPLGTIYQIDGQGIHIYCTGPSTASPTVVISHGQGGNSYEFEWVRRAPQLATARVCTNDRPGHGHSAPWASSSRHYGSAAALTTKALIEAGVSGPIVLVGQSMGNLYNLALAKAIDDDGRMSVVGAVAVDGVDPEWEAGMVTATGRGPPIRRPASNCNKAAARGVVSGEGSFFALVKQFLPFGFTRIGYEINFGGNKEFVGYYPADVQAAQRDIALTDRYFGGILAEWVEFSRNCGHALEGMAVYQRMQAFEVLVSQGAKTIDRYPTDNDPVLGFPSRNGLNLTMTTRLNANSNLVIFPTMTHSATLIYKPLAQGPTADAIRRVLDATSATIAG